MNNYLDHTLIDVDELVSWRYYLPEKLTKMKNPTLKAPNIRYWSKAFCISIGIISDGTKNNIFDQILAHYKLTGEKKHSMDAT